MWPKLKIFGEVGRGGGRVRVDSAAGRAFVLHVINQGFIVAILYGSLSTTSNNS